MEDSTAAVDPQSHSTMGESTSLSNSSDTSIMQEPVASSDLSNSFSMDEDITMPDTDTRSRSSTNDPLMYASMVPIPPDTSATSKSALPSNMPITPIKRYSPQPLVANSQAFSTPPSSQPTSFTEFDQANSSFSRSPEYSAHPPLLSKGSSNGNDPFFRPTPRHSILQQEPAQLSPHIKNEPSSPFDETVAFSKDILRPGGIFDARVTGKNDPVGYHLVKSIPVPIHNNADVNMVDAFADHKPSVGLGSRLISPPKTPMSTAQYPVKRDPAGADSDDVNMDEPENNDENDDQNDDQRGSNYVDEDENSMFLPESPSASKGHRKPMRKKISPQKPKPRRLVPKTAREYFRQQREKQREKDLKNQTLPKPRSRMNSGVRKAKTRRSPKKNQSSLRNLFQSLTDPNQASEPDEFRTVEEPTIIAKTKADQLKQFLNSGDFRGKKPKVLKDLDETSKSFGFNNMKAIDGKWQPKGMRSCLHNHQMMGASWMCKRENSMEGPTGGILADTMGVGKTLQILTVSSHVRVIKEMLIFSLTIVRNPPEEGTPTDQTRTLVIVPSSLLYQWENEIETYACDTLENVHIFRTAEPKSKRFDLVANDVTIATYGQLVKSCPLPDQDTVNELKSNARKEKVDWTEFLMNWINENRRDGGLLHNMEWYRVVLDEAHLIKNYKSKRSIAAAALMGCMRWAMTGTPISNTLEEFFPYFRFMKHPANYTNSVFIETFCAEDKESGEKLSDALREVMLRRTGHDKILDIPILNIPDPITETVVAQQSVQERILYRCIEGRFRELINAHLDNDDPRKTLTYFLVQLLRLRQDTTHPLLIEPQIKKMFTLKELECLRTRMRKVGGKELEARLDVWIKEKGLEPEQEEKFDEKICFICADLPEDPTMISECKHIFCENCIGENTEMQLASGSDELCCPRCYVPFEGTVPVKLKDGKKPKIAKASKKNQKGKDIRKFIPETEFSSWMEQVDRSTSLLLPSAKLTAVETKVRQWLMEAPDEKIIIFTQFKQGATMIGRSLEKMKTEFIYYTGDMGRKERNKTVKEFRENPKCRVMICGLQCGGLGLNLTCASRVIIVDLWWNTCVESQAFGRVHRLGQKKRTYLVRIAVKNSVDTRIMNMQVNKEIKIKMAMKDDLAAEIYLGLFGRVVKDANGNIIRVDADYDDGFDGMVDNMPMDMMTLIDNA